MLKILGSAILTLISLVRTFLYRKAVFKTYKFPARIVSVGNLTMGGSGKTPFVLLVADYFKDKNKIAIVEKGYRSNLKKGEIFLIEKDRNVDISALKHIGDEPLMVLDAVPYGTRLGVCSDKTKAAAAIMKEWPDTELIIIDDGFQHLKLHRDTDIVLMDAVKGFSDRLFPKGKLREPYFALNRADAVIFTRADKIGPEERDNLIELARSYKKGIRIYFSMHKFHVGKFISNKKILPVSAIANPELFHKDLMECGALFDKYIAFRDHHKYSQADYNYIQVMVKKLKPEYIVMTKKDIVKLDYGINLGVPVVPAWYEHQIEHGEEFLCTL